MRDGISTWSALLESGIAATEETLVLFTPYALIAPDHEGRLVHGGSDHIMIYGGPSVLRQPLPAGRNLTQIHLVIGELIVPTVRLIPKALIVPRSAIALGLTEPSKMNPLNRTREYACVRTHDLPRLSFPRSIPQPRSSHENSLEEVRKA